MGTKKLSVSSERSIHTYSYLHSAATCALEQAEETEEGSFYNCMSSIILSAFCIEAYLNYIGSVLLPYWDDEVKQGLSVHNKLKIICHHLNVVPDYSCRPFQSFKQIVKYRNLMAHATSEKISDKGTQMVCDGERVKYPKTWWEENTKIECAKLWVADTESIISIIYEAAGRDDIPPLGMLSMGTSISSVK